MLQPAPHDPAIASETSEANEGRRAPQAPALDPAWRAGRKLAEARRQLGLSLDELADRIRIRREFLEALEDMNMKLLPGRAYALAFLRSYARELGMDEKAITDQFQDECALTREDAQKQIRAPSSRPRRERPWMAAVGLFALAAVFVCWRAVSAPDPADHPIESATIAGATASSAAAGVTPGERRVVEVRAVTDGWLEARGPDGTVFLSRTLTAGDVYRPDASPGWTLHARDGGAFELYVNGAAAGSLGAAGMPVLGRAIDDIRPIAQAGLAEAPRT